MSNNSLTFFDYFVNNADIIVINLFTFLWPNNGFKKFLLFSGHKNKTLLSKTILMKGKVQAGDH